MPNLDDRLHEVESLTRRYARYSRSAGGLGSVLGGVLCLVSYLAGALLPLTPALRMVLVAIPVVWLLGKAWLAHRYYQRLGHVEEQEELSQARVHRLAIATTLLVAIACTWKLLGEGWPPTPGTLGYLVLLWLLPLATWRWLRSPLDFIVGTFLFCQAALACAGRVYPLVGTTHSTQAALMSIVTLEFPLAALAMIVAGIVQHRRFRQLHAQLQQWQADMAMRP